jgi:POT family proton-dependent oligopeptide transporter
VSSPPVSAGTPSALDDRALFGHPRGLGLLFVTEMWERFSYYGMRAILILFLTNAQHWSTADAANLYGNYTALVYLTPLIGGYLADRWIGTRRSLVIGGIIIASGHFTLAFPGLTAFYTGLSLIIIGTGFFKPNVSTMVGQIYKTGDERRDAGFTIFYLGINTGAVLGQTVCGYFGDPNRPDGGQWHLGFAAAGVGMLAGLVVYLWGRDKYLPGIGLGTAAARAKAAMASAAASVADSTTATVKSADAGTVVNGTLGAAAGIVLAYFLSGSSPLGLAFGLTIGASLGISVLGTHGEERKRVYALFLVVFFVACFWASYEQAGSSMNLFAARNTDLHIGSWSVPPAWLQNVNAASIVIFAPVFAAIWVWLSKRGWEPSTPLKMVIGLALLGTGFLFMVEGGRRADTGVLVSPLWLTVAYVLHTWGELCVSPVGLSYTTKVAPARFASLLMGVWFLSNAAANKLAGVLAGLLPTPGEKLAPATTWITRILQESAATHHGFWMIFVVIGFGAAFAMLLCVPMLNRLTSSVKA